MGRAGTGHGVLDVGFVPLNGVRQFLTRGGCRRGVVTAATGVVPFVVDEMPKFTTVVVQPSVESTLRFGGGPVFE